MILFTFPIDEGRVAELDVALVLDVEFQRCAYCQRQWEAPALNTAASGGVEGGAYLSMILSQHGTTTPV